MGEEYSETVRTAPRPLPLPFPTPKDYSEEVRSAPPTLPGARPPRGPNEPFGELSEPSYSPSQTIRNWIQDIALGLGGYTARAVSPYVAGKTGDVLGGVLGTIAGPFVSGADLKYHMDRGEAGQAAISALGLVGGAPAARSLLREARTMLPAARPPPWASGLERAQWTNPASEEVIDAMRRNYATTRNLPVSYDYRIGDAIEQQAARALRGVPQQAADTAMNEVRRARAVWDQNINPVTGQRMPVTANDLDYLRQSLQGLEGAEGTAGRHIVAALDSVMTRPPPGYMISGTNLIPQLEDAFASARQNRRVGGVMQEIENAITRARLGTGATYSGLNLENKIRQEFKGLVNPPKGGPVAGTGQQAQVPLEFATPAERQLVENVAERGAGGGSNALRWAGNLLGGGGGLGAAVTPRAILGGPGSSTAAHFLGLDPITAGATGLATTGAMIGAGRGLRALSNARTANAAENVVEQIGRGSPEFARRAALPENMPVNMEIPQGGALPSQLRDAIAYAMIPEAARGANRFLDEAYVPYANREPEDR